MQSNSFFWRKLLLFLDLFSLFWKKVSQNIIGVAFLAFGQTTLTIFWVSWIISKTTALNIGLNSSVESES